MECNRNKDKNLKYDEKHIKMIKLSVSLSFALVLQVS